MRELKELNDGARRRGWERATSARLLGEQA